MMMILKYSTFLLVSVAILAAGCTPSAQQKPSAVEQQAGDTLLYDALAAEIAGHKGLLEGPHRSVDGQRDLAFFILGANSDVLVSEGGYLYMRQKKMTPELKEVEVDVLSSKGAQDVGLHVFSTAGLLDGSWYNIAKIHALCRTVIPSAIALPSRQRY